MKLFLRIILISILFIFNSYFSNAQDNTKIDSIKNLLNKYQESYDDINVMNLLISLSSEISPYEPDEAIKYLNQAKSISLRLQDKYHLAQIFNKIGNIYEQNKMYQMALENFVKGYSAMLDADKKDSVGYLLVDIAKMYSIFSIKELPVKYFKKAIAIFYTNKDIYGLSLSNAMLGDYYFENSSLDSSIKYLNNAIKYRQQLPSNIPLAHSYNSIGKAYFKKGEFTKAINYIYEALNIAKKGNRNDNNIKFLLSDAYHSLAKVYINFKELEKAHNYLQNSISAIKNIPSGKAELSSLYYDLGKLYFVQGKYNDAINQAKIALEISDSSDNISCKKDCYLLLSDIHHLLGQHEVAFNFQLLYQQLINSTGEKYLREKVSEMDATINIYQREKELEIKEINLEKERSKTSQQILLLSTGFIFLLIISILLFNLNRRKKIDNKLLSEKNIEISNQKDEIQNNNNSLLQLLNEKIKIEEALNNAYQFNKEIISYAGEGIVVYNNKFEYLIWNKFMEEFTGINSSEIIGKNAFEVYPHLIESGIDKLIQSALSGEYCISPDLFFNIKSTGKKGWFIGAFVPHFDSNKNIIGVIATIQDISAHKKVENELKKAKEKAEESDFIKSAFLANMSHEIRTPLNAIIGFTSLIKKDAAIINESKKYLEIIYNSGFHLLHLINDIIDLSKIEAGYIKIDETVCILKQILLEIYNTFYSEVSIKKDNKINLVLNYTSINSNQKVWIDDLRLKQILTNLLSNSVKFTREGTIEFGVNITNDKKFLEFYVKDSGIGISEDHVKIIFERFRQADESTTRKYGGSGLGLAISRELVKLMNGNIWVASQSEKGSTFYFTIPFRPVENDVENKTAMQVFTTNYNWENKILLIVDDVEDIHLLYKDVLNNTKIKIINAENGQQAVDLCMNQKIDLVLMDIRIPLINGYEATKLIKTYRKDIPIIAQTAYAFPEDKLKCIEAGCDDFISKPIQMQNLFELLAKYLNG
jgi:PAS domain S-box-containing protein